MDYSFFMYYFESSSTIKNSKTMKNLTLILKNNSLLISAILTVAFFSVYSINTELADPTIWIIGDYLYPAIIFTAAATIAVFTTKILIRGFKEKGSLTTAHKTQLFIMAPFYTFIVLCAIAIFVFDTQEIVNFFTL